MTERRHETTVDGVTVWADSWQTVWEGDDSSGFACKVNQVLPDGRTTHIEVYADHYYSPHVWNEVDMTVGTPTTDKRLPHYALAIATVLVEAAHIAETGEVPE